MGAGSALGGSALGGAAGSVLGGLAASVLGAGAGVVLGAGAGVSCAYARLPAPHHASAATGRARAFGCRAQSRSHRARRVVREENKPCLIKACTAPDLPHPWTTDAQ